MPRNARVLLLSIVLHIERTGPLSTDHLVWVDTCNYVPTAMPPPGRI